jgi:hypothetical protein
MGGEEEVVEVRGGEESGVDRGGGDAFIVLLYHGIEWFVCLFVLLPKHEKIVIS